MSMFGFGKNIPVTPISNNKDDNNITGKCMNITSLLSV